jgi:hypothetical protein
MVLTFMIFWAPLQFLTVYRFYDDQIAYSKYFGDIFFVCHIIAVSRSFINPFIYTSTNSKYREGFKYFICCFCIFKKDANFYKPNSSNNAYNSFVPINTQHNFIGSNSNLYANPNYDKKYKLKQKNLNSKPESELLRLNRLNI